MPIVIIIIIIIISFANLAVKNKLWELKYNGGGVLSNIKIY